MENNDIKKEFKKINTIQERIDRKDLPYEVNDQLFNFHQFDTIKFFSESIFNGKIKLSGADKQENNLSSTTLELNSKVRTKAIARKNKKNLL